MTKALFIFLMAFTLAVKVAVAQDARAVLDAVARNMGTARVNSLEYSTTTGWYGRFGQTFLPSEDLPRTDITQYMRAIDYDTGFSREDFTHRQSNPPVWGGGMPFRGDQRVVSIVNGEHAWTTQGENIVPQPDAAELRQLEILLTPHGFLKAAMQRRAEPTAISRFETNEVAGVSKRVTIVSIRALGKYTLNAQINEDNLIDAVMTWVPTPVLGDTLYEGRYTDYRDYDGVKMPTRLHYHRGNRFVAEGINALDLTLDEVRLNATIADQAVPGAVREARIPPVRVEAQELADGVWMMAGGTHHSVAVEFDDFVAVVEAPQNDARSVAVIEEVTRLVPTKPIRYVVNTHHHFDHSGGLRTYVAHGATVITHRENEHFYERAVLYQAPRTLQPDRLSLYPPRTTNGGLPPFIEVVGERYVLSDGTRTLQLYPVMDTTHSGSMLIAYLPSEKILINADLYAPFVPGAPVPPALMPSILALNRNIERLRLDVERHAPIHGQVVPHEEFLRVVRSAPGD